MSRAPINRDPAGYICDGRRLVGYLFDTAAGTVATLGDRLPLGTFPDWKAARVAIREADAAQERGEIATVGNPAIVPDGNNKATAAEIGISRKDIHEARMIREAAP